MMVMYGNHEDSIYIFILCFAVNSCISNENKIDIFYSELISYHFI